MTRNRKSIRLPDYDYSNPGAYFVTICVKDHARLFGSIHNSVMRENEFAKIVRECWNDLPNHYPSVKLDSFVIMPNHIHGIIVIVDDKFDVGAGLGVDVGSGFKPAPTTNTTNTNTPKRHGLSEIVRALKTFSARHINEIRKSPGVSVWQRNFFEHIIRNESALYQIRKYIDANPANWKLNNENSISDELAPCKNLVIRSL